MAKHTFKTLQSEYRKILRVCLAIFQHYERKGYIKCLRTCGRICVVDMSK